MSAAPRVAVSMGDPTGIGPEVTLAALAPAGAAAAAAADPGRRPRHLSSTPPAACGSPLRFAAWEPPSRCRAARSPCARSATLPARQRRPGQPTLAGGRAAHAAIVEALRLVRSGVADALVTAPICKANLVAAGIRVNGHTELLAHLCGDVPVRMMMIGDTLRVALVTTHLALRAVPRRLRRRRRARPPSASPTAPCASGSASAARGSASPASTRTPASRGCSATRRSA